MTEAQLTQQLLSTNEVFFNAISVGFTLYSAYIVGLYWFLSKAGLLMRSVAFALLSLCTALLGVAGFGIIRHSQGVTQALIELSSAQALSRVGEMAIEPTAQNVAESISSGLVGLLLFIYLGSFYLTFIYRWVKR